MNRACSILLLSTILSAAAPLAAAEPNEDTPAMPRIPSVDQIARMLPAEPAGLGVPITDRKTWDTLARTGPYRSVVARAERLLREPMPKWSDELYLDFSRNGNRTNFQKLIGKRHARLRIFAVAECAENQGRFLRPLTEAIASVCDERTWVVPAHDRGLRNFRGTAIDIDLRSAHLAWEIATVDHLLGEKLPKQTRALIRANVERRALKPFEEMLAGRRKHNWWMHKTNNWNAVCLAGITGAAITNVRTPQRRAKIIHAAMTYVQNFLKGFPADGYCTEGLGYWGYGYGHYVRLSETIRHATDGQIDLMDWPAAREPGLFPDRIEIINGVSPAFADCRVFAKADQRLRASLRHRLTQGGAGVDVFKPAEVWYRPGNDSSVPAARTAPAGARTYFEDAGVLICRPGAFTSCRIGVALKGGHNAEHHNHNDLGSFVVVLGNRPVLVDPGSEVYTARTFSGRRYDSDVLNSFGHSVPRVAGQLQAGGRTARAEIVKAHFTDRADTFVLDLRRAYGVKGLRKLTRTFVFSRTGAGSLTVTDSVTFDSPQTFETALITLGGWKEVSPGVVTITDKGQTLRVKISATGGKTKIAATKLTADVHLPAKPTRIGIGFVGVVKTATVTTVISPVK